MQQIKDPDVQTLVSIAGMFKERLCSQWDNDPWVVSPFGWIRTRPSRQRGRIGEQLVAGWCAAKGLDVTSSRNPEADRVIAGKRVEIKFSTLWESGVYKFQQIRDQDYEYFFFRAKRKAKNRIYGILGRVAEKRTLTHERVDDIPLLIGLAQTLHLPEILDRHLGHHGNHQGLRNGWLATVWLASILSESDHRTSSVEEWTWQHRQTLERLLGQPIRPAE